ncbi:MAG: tail protein X [Lentisphaeraceae bacterium]|nr:tail protein X [Lentisphaeraceae bacterium]
MTTYRTKDGDMIDDIAHRYYGSQVGAVEEILKANRELAFQSLLLPAGITIKLPVLEPVIDNDKIRLWD